MTKLIKILFYCILFIFLCLVFIPKENIYFLGEKQLKKYNIIISDEKIKSSLFKFEINQANVYINKINIAKVDKIIISFSGIKLFSKEIGQLSSKINIKNKSIVINFKPTYIFIQKYRKIILKYFEKQKKGVYKYEYKLF